jgi:hypothetical protein
LKYIPERCDIVPISKMISTDALQKFGDAVRGSQLERSKFERDPVGYLKSFGITLSPQHEKFILNQKANLKNVLNGMHSPVAAIAVA